MSSVYILSSQWPRNMLGLHLIHCRYRAREPLRTPQTNYEERILYSSVPAVRDVATSCWEIPYSLNSCAIPIYTSAAFAFNDSQHGVRLLNLTEFGNIYSRITNLTVSVFQSRMAAFEGGVAACATACGTTAMSMTLMALTGVGDNIDRYDLLSVLQVFPEVETWGWSGRIKCSRY